MKFSLWPTYFSYGWGCDLSIEQSLLTLSPTRAIHIATICQMPSRQTTIGQIS